MSNYWQDYEEYRALQLELSAKARFWWTKKAVLNALTSVLSDVDAIPKFDQERVVLTYKLVKLCSHWGRWPGEEEFAMELRRRRDEKDRVLLTIAEVKRLIKGVEWDE